MSQENLRLGVILDSDISLGGAFQQSSSAIKLIRDLPKDLVTVKIYSTVRQEKDNNEIKYIHLNLLKNLLLSLRRRVTNYRVLRIIKFFKRYNSFERYLIKDNIDLVYFLSPSPLADNLEDLNYVITVWDLCHRQELEFPEVRANREFERREKKYKKILPKAVGIIADSDIGKNNLIKYYNLDYERIIVIPFDIPEQIKIKKEVDTSLFIKHDIKTGNYLLYPAQFWAHKNHVYILDSLREYENIYGETIDVVFTGNDKGNLHFIMDYVKRKKLKSKVHFLGFVEETELIALYQNALALIMPTYFGPMNIPPLEAFYHKLPVLYPNKRGLIEIFTNSVIQIDIEDPLNCASSLNKLKRDRKFRNQFIQYGEQELNKYSQKENLDELIRLIENYRIKRKLWK